MTEFNEITKPILKLISEGTATLNELAEKLSLCPEDVRCALVYLMRASLLSIPSSGVYSLTAKGERALEDDPDIIDISYLAGLDSGTTRISYSEQPTLLVGLGGFASRIADGVYSHVQEKEYVSAFSIDTDQYEARNLKNIPKEHIISIAQNCRLVEVIGFLPDARQWVPDNPLLFHKTLSEGAGQVRAVARLAYEMSLKEKRFDALLSEVDRLAQECIEKNCRMRVSIIATLVGGTASGIFMQTALLIRERISTRYPSLNAKIHGELILPATFLSYYNVSPAERRNLESNTYAALKELNAVNEHYFCNTPPLEMDCGQNGRIVDALPFDYCFLYDRVNPDNANNRYIEAAVTERLFSPSANEINEAFVDSLRTDTRKRAGNIYGTFYTEKLPLSASVYDSEIFRFALNGSDFKRILSLRSPRPLNIDTGLFARGTVLVQSVDPAAEGITVSEFCLGIELSQLDKIRIDGGQYYASYKRVIENLPMTVTPHLHRSWHKLLNDIGKEEKEAYIRTEPAPLIKKTQKDTVFISYSSAELEIADKIRRTLESNGISCWMAPESIPAGSDYAKEIPRAINACKAFLLVLSDAAQRSSWVPKEVGLAIGKRKTVVPFHIDDSQISDDFDFYLTNCQRISAHNRMEDACRELIRRLKDLLGC